MSIVHFKSSCSKTSMSEGTWKRRWSSCNSSLTPCTLARLRGKKTKLLSSLFWFCVINTIINDRLPRPPVHFLLGEHFSSEVCARGWLRCTLGNERASETLEPATGFLRANTRLDAQARQFKPNSLFLQMWLIFFGWMKLLNKLESFRLLCQTEGIIKRNRFFSLRLFFCGVVHNAHTDKQVFGLLLLSQLWISFLLTAVSSLCFSLIHCLVPIYNLLRMRPFCSSTINSLFWCRLGHKTNMTSGPVYIHTYWVYCSFRSQVCYF